MGFVICWISKWYFSFKGGGVVMYHGIMFLADTRSKTLHCIRGNVCILCCMQASEVKDTMNPTLTLPGLILE